MTLPTSYDVRYIMCWHGLPAYWGGIMPGAPALAGVSGARTVYPKPTEGIAEIEPSLMWSPAVLAGACRGRGCGQGQGAARGCGAGGGGAQARLFRCQPLRCCVFHFC